MNVPGVDLSPVRTGEGDLQQLVGDIDAACRDTGFFAVVGHGIPLAARAAAFNAAREFFDLPLEAKEEIAIGRSSAHRGYVALEAETLQPDLGADAKEAIDIGLELPPDHDALQDGQGVHGPNQWPELEGFREAVLAYYALALDAAMVTLRAIALALELRPGFFDRRMRLPMCNLRMLHYPPVPTPNDDRLGCGAHSDYGTITLLATDDEPGLELRRRDGTWTSVAAPPDALVVNLGDLLARWTNGRYVSTVHRVISPTERHRYSIPFFVNPDAETVVSPVRSCVDADHPDLDEPITARDYLLSRFDDTHAYRSAGPAD
ncbi:MAG: 2-oxoglutarate and iron-dependent oxygenase domain-containing protein [Actinomycetota bacterium]